MQKLVAKIFRKYGVPIDIPYSGSMYRVYGFVRNGASSARKYLLTEYTPLGEVPMGFCVILLPPHETRVGGKLQHGTKWYIVRRVESVQIHNEELYDWCLCEEQGKEDSWGY